MSQIIPNDDRQFCLWTLNFSNQLLKLGSDFDIKEVDNNQLKKLTKSVENDIIKSEMGIGQDLLHKFHRKQLLKKLILNFIDKIKQHPNYSEKIHAKKFGFDYE